MKKLALLLIALFSLTSCSIDDITNIINPGNNQSETQSETIPSESSEEESESEIISESESESETISESESESEITSESESEEIFESEVGIEIPSTGETLPDGTTSLPGPKNHENPYDLSEQIDFNLVTELPSYFSYYYGGEKKENYTFYSLNYDNLGGLKFNKVSMVLQTPVFFSPDDKVSITLTIGKMFASTTEVKDDPEILHIYGYGIDGHFIAETSITNDAYNINNYNYEISTSITHPKLAYLEFRLNAKPHFDGGSYNFGLLGISLKGGSKE